MTLPDEVVAVGGLGKAMVRASLRRVPDAMIASRKLEKREKLAAEVGDKFGVRVLPDARIDSDRTRCDEAIGSASTALGRVDVLVNNARISQLTRASTRSMNPCSTR